MSLIDRLISRVVPYDCLGCSREGQLLCAGCRSRLTLPSPCCYRCRQPSGDSLTCHTCLDETRLYRVRAAVVYKSLAKDLVWKLKFGHAQGAARELATLMTPLLFPASDRNRLLVPVPTASTRVRQRGYDQARVLARELAARSRLPYAPVLARQDQTHQVGAGRDQRLSQLAGAFRIARPQLIRGAHLILVDDVVTTGATLEAAAAVLHQAGAAQIEAVAFARPPSPHCSTRRGHLSQVIVRGVTLAYTGMDEHR